MTPTDRVARGVLSLIAGSFAVSTIGTQPWCAVPAAVCSVLLAVGAITGWCPTDLLRAREVAPNRLGLAEARQPISVTPEDRQ